MNDCLYSKKHLHQAEGAIGDAANSLFLMWFPHCQRGASGRGMVAGMHSADLLIFVFGPSASIKLLEKT